MASSGNGLDGACWGGYRSIHDDPLEVQKREPGKHTGEIREVLRNCPGYDAFYCYAAAYFLQLLMLGGQGSKG